MKYSDVTEAYHLAKILDVLRKVDDKIKEGGIENFHIPISVGDLCIPLELPVSYADIVLGPLKIAVQDALTDLGVTLETGDNQNADKLCDGTPSV